MGASGQVNNVEIPRILGEPLIHTFGPHILQRFEVITDEVFARIEETSGLGRR